MRRLENSNGTQPYNLIITKHWMLIVLRTRPSVHGIDVNSLGYMGMMYVRDEDQMKLLKERKPLEILTSLALPVFGRVNVS